MPSGMTAIQFVEAGADQINHYGYVRRADLLILDGNPLENISNVRRVHAVVAAGTMLDPAPLWRLAGFRP
jgi:hypothetical protein